MSKGHQVDAANEREARLNETVTLTRRELRANAAANWDAGYQACKEGRQRHNPYHESADLMVALVPDTLRRVVSRQESESRGAPHPPCGSASEERCIHGSLARSCRGNR